MGVTKPKKKRYTVYLTENTTERMKVELEKAGSGLSQYIDSILKEGVKMFDGAESIVPMSKPMSEMTLKEFKEISEYFLGTAQKIDEMDDEGQDE